MFARRCRELREGVVPGGAPSKRRRCGNGQEQGSAGRGETREAPRERRDPAEDVGRGETRGDAGRGKTCRLQERGGDSGGDESR